MAPACAATVAPKRVDTATLAAGVAIGVGPITVGTAHRPCSPTILIIGMRYQSSHLFRFVEVAATVRAQAAA